jgi:hypothetical protein
VPRAKPSPPAKTPDPDGIELPPPSLDRLRTAMKFSLWMWAAYWPGGGLLLLMGGLDPISLAVTLGSLACFILLIVTGALRADSSHTVKEFLVERPLYVVVALALFIVVAALLPDIEGIALLIFAVSWFGGLALTALRLRDHVVATGRSLWQARADQMAIVLAMAGFFSLLVFLDALLPVMAGDDASLGSPSALVAVSTWANLLYPGLLMLASKPFRAPLRWPSRKDRIAPAARRAKVAKDPVPFRAS